jgi:predicted lipoprotein with Yx(FWY)xxD motif
VAATVRTVPANVAGTSESVLVNAHGLPLYFYRPDTAAKSFVTGSLARLWPPLTSAAPTPIATPPTGHRGTSSEGHTPDRSTDIPAL